METGLRFRSVGWVCFAIVVVTGTFNLWVHGVRWDSFTDREWLASSFGHAVIAKLAVFAAVLTVSLVHDFVVGPRATRAITRGGSVEEVARLPTPANHRAHEKELVVLRNKGPVNPDPPPMEIELKMIGRKIRTN